MPRQSLKVYGEPGKFTEGAELLHPDIRLSKKMAFPFFKRMLGRQVKSQEYPAADVSRNLEEQTQSLR